MWRRLLYILAGVLFAAGAALLILPAGARVFGGYQSREQIRDFEQSVRKTREKNGDSKDGALREQMREYNVSIYENGQKDLKDVWSYERNPFDFQAEGLPDDMIGYITIDAMEEEMPLYIGANEENMKKGAVVMGQTSMPVGGKNTNCVIAAHRGYRGIPMFQYIEILQPGDKVEITNLWETLEYEVVKCIVIRPDDIDAVKIVPGEDMVTLITCHPYTKNYQRYVVYCRRTDGGEDTGSAGTSDGGRSDTDRALAERTGIAYESSEEAIRREELFNTAVSAILCIGAAAVLCVFIGKKIGKNKRIRKKRKKKQNIKKRKIKNGT